MRRMVHILFLAVTGFFLAGYGGSGNVIAVNSVEIHGLKNMTRTELMQGVRMKSTDRGVAMDLDSLRDALSKNRFIRSHRITESGDTLIIVVEERVPVRLLLLRKGEELVALEVDEYGSIVSVNRIHRPLSPVIMIDETDIVKGTLSPAVMRLFSLMDDVRTACPRLYGQIELVDAQGMNSIGVRIRGRKTLYTLSPDMVQFTRLQYLVGYLDGKREYPATVLMSGDKALVRQ